MDNETLIRDVDFAFLDIETTGLAVERGHRICEIAIVAGATPSLRDRAWLVNPQRQMGAKAKALHGLEGELLEAPTFAEIASQVWEGLAGRVIVGHGVWFDVKFLWREFEAVGFDLPPVLCVDTLGLARRHQLGSDSHKLSALRPRVGDAGEGYHRAMFDAYACAALFDELVATYQLKRLGQCLARRWRYSS